MGRAWPEGAEGPHSGPWKVLVTEVDPELSRAPQSALFNMGVWPSHQPCSEERLFLSIKGGVGLNPVLSCSIRVSEKGPHSSTVPPPQGVLLNSWSWDTPGCELRSGMNPLVF